jgi:Tfp pilus assembly protein PilF
VRSVMGDRQGAIVDFNRAIQLDPNSARAYNNRGATKSELGDKRGAIDDYNRAIALAPKFAEAFYNRGAAKYQLGDKRGALTDFNLAIALDPKSAMAYYSRAVVRADLGNKQGAIDDYDRAIQLDPQFASAYYNRGAIKSELGDRLGAAADFDRSVALNPYYADKDYSHNSIAQSTSSIIFHPYYSGGYYRRGHVIYYNQNILTGHHAGSINYIHSSGNNTNYNNSTVIVNPTRSNDVNKQQTTIIKGTTIESAERENTPKPTRTNRTVRSRQEIENIPNYTPADRSPEQKIDRQRSDKLVPEAIENRERQEQNHAPKQSQIVPERPQFERNERSTDSDRSERTDRMEHRERDNRR